MNPRYFLKVNLLNSLTFGDQSVDFKPCGNNTGVLSTTNEALAEHLAKLHKSRIGGVMEITAEQYASKKNEPITRPTISNHIQHQAKVMDLQQEVPGFVKSSPESEPPTPVVDAPRKRAVKRARRTSAIVGAPETATPPTPEVGLP